MRTDVHEMVTARIIAKLEAGTIPWKHFAWSPLLQPMNLVSKRAYHGINYLLLSHSRFNSPYWLTFNQAQEVGGYVRKGEKSELVVFLEVVRSRGQRERRNQGNSILALLQRV